MFSSQKKIKVSHQPLGKNQVYKINHDINNNVKFKGGWFMKQYLQQFGIDFDQSYTSIIKPMAFRTLFALITIFDLDIDQMDIKITFFYGLIIQRIYREI